MADHKQYNKHILSIDGGGIRGIIPLCILREIELQTKKLPCELFDFVAGTSTGAIISGALAASLTAEQVLDLYLRLYGEVFKRDWKGFITSLGSYKYSSSRAARLYEETIGNISLNDLPVDIMLTAVRVTDRKQWYFVKDTLNNSKTTGNLRLVDCIAASAAAPTYFSPYPIQGVGLCVDGGVGTSGNPVYQACIEAAQYTEEGMYPPDSTLVLSLGTGTYEDYSSPRWWGDWVKWSLFTSLSSPVEQQTRLAKGIYDHVLRINPVLPRGIDMDEISAVDELVEIGKKVAQEIDMGAFWK